MGVYNPNMEKPKGCYYCPLEQLSGCRLLDNKFVEEIDPNDCPLIEIVTCGECKHFHYDKPYVIQGMPILGHDVCDFWGDGCKTNPNGFCSYGERRE